MNIVDNPMSSGFHDTVLRKASQNGSTISMNIEYYTEDDVEVFVKVTISGVEQVFSDDLPLGDFRMETEHGSIIVLEQRSSEVILVLVWLGFESKKDITSSYRMVGTKIQLLTEPG